jgi:hypothetical protein
VYSDLKAQRSKDPSRAYYGRGIAYNNMLAVYILHTIVLLFLVYFLPIYRYIAERLVISVEQEAQSV